MKKLFFAAACSLFMTSTFAANSVTLTNNTDDVISLEAVQLGACTPGIPAHKTVTIPAESIANICRRFEHNCIGDFYASNDCSGASIARGVIDVDTGVVAVQGSGDYALEGAGDHLSISHK